MKIKVSLIVLMVSLVFLVGCAGISKHYTKDVIERKTGWTKMSEKECSEGSVSYNRYWFAGKRTTYVDAMMFLVCKNDSQAGKLLKELKKYYDVTEETKDYFIGYETGVTDCTVKEFVYRSGNLIVRMEIEVDGHFYNGLGYQENPEPGTPLTEEDLISDIIKNW